MGNTIKAKACSKFYKILLVSLLVLVGICIWQGLFYINGEPSIDKYSPSILLLGIFVLSASLMAVANIIKSCSEKGLRIISFILLGSNTGKSYFFRDSSLHMSRRMI